MKRLRTTPRFSEHVLRLFLPLALFTIWGCGSSSSTPSTIIGGNSGYVPPGSRVVPQSGWRINNPAYIQPAKKWTVLVYLNAANDLEEFGTLNANQMETVGSTDTVNIVVQFKRIQGRYDNSDGNWGGTRRYYISHDNAPSHVSSAILSDRSNVNMGDPQTLQEFIQWGVNTYPAEHYCLVVWNHGAGWRSQKTSRTSKLQPVSGYRLSRGVSYDDEYMINGYSSHIDTVQLPAALSLGNGKKWDLLAWDSSLMQMAEVAYEIRNQASYIVGSEESPPGSGYPYDAILGDLVASPDKDGKSLGISFAQRMLQDNGAGSDITESVLDTSQLGAIVPALDNLGSALTTVQALYGSPISRARSTSENYAYPENHDLLNFLERLETADFYTGEIVGNDTRVAGAITQLRNAVNAAIVFNNNGTGHPNSNGLSVFLPTPYNYQLIDIEQANGFGQRYSTLALPRNAPHWQNFLASGPP